jgi:hypothetical protein
VEYIYFWHSTDVSCQAKQLQIDELLSKLNNAGGDLERLREDKEQEIMILQAAMDNTIEQLSDAQQNQGLADETANAQIDTLILDNRKKTESNY